MTIPLTLHMDSDALAAALVNDPAACATKLRELADAITNEPGTALIDHRGSIS